MFFLSTLDIHLHHEDHDAWFCLFFRLELHSISPSRYVPQAGFERSKVEMFFDDSHLDVHILLEIVHDNTTTTLDMVNISSVPDYCPL